MPDQPIEIPLADVFLMYALHGITATRFRDGDHPFVNNNRLILAVPSLSIVCRFPGEVSANVSSMEPSYVGKFFIVPLRRVLDLSVHRHISALHLLDLTHPFAIRYTLKSRRKQFLPRYIKENKCKYRHT